MACIFRLWVAGAALLARFNADHLAQQSLIHYLSRREYSGQRKDLIARNESMNPASVT